MFTLESLFCADDVGQIKNRPHYTGLAPVGVIVYGFFKPDDFEVAV
ncbi:MAG: hypothetical protein BWY82_02115 [Verrucomicrobia bacterium ADurb.Bin474]|nr:MAG: hypothetical protein BWY82_02115 [Verrucomicrobia bacterium ADurb.Bin474]